MTTAEYREKINTEYPEYRTIHSTRIEKATRILINEYPLEYDSLLRSGPSHPWAKAELRRRLQSQYPGATWYERVRLGLTQDQIKAWPWS